MSKIHKNSQDAYWEQRKKLSKRAEAIWQILIAHSPLTDRQILDIMGLPDMNNVRPRITELIQMGFVEEVGNIKCKVTKKKVRVVRATSIQDWHIAYWKKIEKSEEQLKLEIS